MFGDSTFRSTRKTVTLGRAVLCSCFVVGVVRVSPAQQQETPRPTSTAHFEAAPSPPPSASAPQDNPGFSPATTAQTTAPSALPLPGPSPPGPSPPSAGATTPVPGGPPPLTPSGPPPPPPPGPYYYYYYYPPPAPGAERAERYPEIKDRAVRTAPFLDLDAGGLFEQNRFSSPLVFSVRLGTYIAKAVRVAVQAGTFVGDPDLNLVSSPALPDGFSETTRSRRPVVVLGGSVGYALVSTPGFALAPGFVFLTTDVGAFGSAAGVHIPFDWVSRSGMRIGFEGALMRAFGGSVRATCAAFPPGSSSSPTSCDSGEVRDFNRPAGSAFYLGFEIGFGFNKPKPEQLRR